MTRVLGIDSALAKLGYGLLDNKRCVDYGVITTTAGEAVEKRLDDIEKDVKLLIKQTSPDQVCIETPFFSGGNSNASIVLNAVGVIRLAVWRSGITPILITPSQAKKAVTGNGNAKKPVVMAAVRELFGMSVIKAPDDVFDAIAIAYACSCGLSADVRHSQGAKDTGGRNSKKRKTA